MENRETVSLTLDIKKSRLILNQTTVKAMGNPNMVQLLISQEANTIMILGVNRHEPGGQELVLRQARPHRYYEIYSRAFMHELQRMTTGLECCCTYRIRGRVVKNGQGTLFPLEKLEIVEVQNEQNRPAGACDGSSVLQSYGTADRHR